MFWNSSWKFCELAPHMYRCLLVVQEALFLEVCSFSHPAFFCSTLLEGPVEASPSSASWAGQSISSALPRCLPGRWTFLALELFPFSWAHKDCVDKNVLKGSKQPNSCFCILWCFVWLQLITNTHTSQLQYTALTFVGFPGWRRAKSSHSCCTRSEAHTYRHPDTVCLAQF